MKIAILVGAALLGAAGVAPVQADAQRYGYQDRYDGRGQGWRDDRGSRGDRNWRGDRRWRDGRGWRGDRGWNRGYRARGRTVCRLERGYYGPIRRCFRINR